MDAGDVASMVASVSWDMTCTSADPDDAERIMKSTSVGPAQGYLAAHGLRTEQARRDFFGEDHIPSQGVWQPAGCAIIGHRWQGQNRTCADDKHLYRVHKVQQDNTKVHGVVRTPAGEDIVVCTGSWACRRLVQLCRDCFQLLLCQQITASKKQLQAPSAAAITCVTAALLETEVDALTNLTAAKLTAICTAGCATLHAERMVRAHQFDGPGFEAERSHVALSRACDSVAKVLQLSPLQPAVIAEAWEMLGTMPRAMMAAAQMAFDRTTWWKHHAGTYWPAGCSPVCVRLYPLQQGEAQELVQKTSLTTPSDWSRLALGATGAHPGLLMFVQ